MSNLKALILGTLLLVPILILGFIAVFGEHHFTLPNYYPKLDATGQVQYTAQGDTVFHEIPDFTLLSNEGKVITEAELQGDIYVTHFFSTDCPPACKNISSQLVRIQETFEDKPEVKIVSITVEPEKDSVEALQNYAANYGAEAGKWYFLTGDKQEIFRLAKEGFFLPEAESQQGLTHSEQLMLVDKEGRIRGVYEGTDLKEIDRLKTEINVLLDEYSKRK
ncbi:SCO family protein [Pontibacter diazotrophicus]|uniref:SCO family protein n=1 Tax=Pontibacter diazotrophicus TaxID=1400979 RepID=A0A3D8L745_9BACT|nr:SCO family protein [Pontibacter diazotrophicus]RDV13143.1 SCO family protein [Pontibacter diazotrophicus]